MLILLLLSSHLFVSITHCTVFSVSRSLLFISLKNVSYTVPFLAVFLVCQSGFSTSCHVLFSKNSDQPVLLRRYGYLPIQPVQTYAMPDSTWFMSTLSLESGAPRSWIYQPNPSAVNWVFRPDINRQANEGNFFARGPLDVQSIVDNATYSTQAASKTFLSYVYETFSNALKKRDVFTPEFIEQLGREDRMRQEKNWTMWTVESASGELLAAWGVYRHEENMVEVIRLAKTTQHLSLDELMTFVSEYLVLIQMPFDGTVIVRTDKVGNRYFSQKGGKTIEEYEDGKFLLHIGVSEFVQIFQPQQLEGPLPLQDYM